MFAPTEPKANQLEVLIPFLGGGGSQHCAFLLLKFAKSEQDCGVQFFSNTLF